METNKVGMVLGQHMDQIMVLGQHMGIFSIGDTF